MSAQNFHPAIASEMTWPATIASAYRAAGITPPTRDSECVALLAAELTVDHVAQSVATSMVTTTDPKAWLAESIAAMTRARSADAIKDAVGRYATLASRTVLSSWINDASKDLTPFFTATTKALTAAAKALPAGDQQLEVNAIVATDATKELKAATAALHNLATIAAVFGQRPPVDINPDANAALAVVDLPANFDQEVITSLARVTLNPSRVRDVVRKFVTDAGQFGADRALIGVARGDYPGLSIAMPSSRAAVSERRAVAAMSVRRFVDKTAQTAPARV